METQRSMSKMKNGNRPQPLRFVARIVIIWAIEVFALLLMYLVLPGLDVDSIWTAIVAVAVAGVLNAILWPTLTYVLLPFAVFTLGLFTLLLNGLLVLFASELVPGIRVDGIWTAIVLTVGVTAINTILSSLLTIDDDNSYYRNVVYRRMRRAAKTRETDAPGVLFLEIDGLSKPVLERVIREGYMPTLQRWLETGSHKLIGWECDLSSQTSSSQAGILHGNNDNIPAFRWWDRTRKRIVSSSDPQEVARLERAHSDGNGLLAADGASRGNLFSGDAPTVTVTASTITDLSRFRPADFYSYFVNPYSFTRTLLLTFWDISLEIRQFRRARRQGAYPISDKKKRGGTYPLLRAFTTIVMRELNIYTLIGDMFAGVPVAYATFVGYDEVAHYSGVESEDAFDVLYKLDQQFARLENATKQAPRPYRLVLLSDHGQSGGATFKQRYDMTLEEVVQKLASNRYRVRGDVDVHEDWQHVNVFLTEAIHHDNKSVGRLMGRVLRNHTHEGQVALGPEGEKQRQKEAVSGIAKEKGSQIVVLTSGNLGLVYASDTNEQVNIEEIEAAYPGLLNGLAQHDGIGFVMAHSEAHGPVVLGVSGRHYLTDERVEGSDPLAGFGTHAVEHLRRTASFPDAPDILVNSFYDPVSNEVAAFEEQIGCHGGLGGWQAEPFLLYPAGWETDLDEIIGAEAVYQILKGWLNHLATGSASVISTIGHFGEHDTVA